MAKILRKQIPSVYILFSPKFQAKPTPDLGANEKDDRSEVKNVNNTTRVTCILYNFLTIQLILKAKVQTLVNNKYGIANTTSFKHFPT